MSNSTKAKYTRREAQKETIPDSEIRISHNKPAGLYINRAAILFLENKLDTVVIKAIDNAIPIALTVADVLRRRIENLSQVLIIRNTEIKDIYDPKEEGLDVITHIKVLSMLEIKLTTAPTKEDTSAAGYEKPKEIKKEEVFTLEKIQNFRRREEGDNGRRVRRDGEEGGDRRGGDRRGGDRRGGDRREGSDRRKGSFSDSRRNDRRSDNRRNDATRGERRNNNEGARRDGARRDGAPREGGSRRN